MMSKEISLNKCVKEVEAVQAEIEKLHNDFSAEVLELESEVNKWRGPRYRKRNTFIQQVPYFWYKVFCGHPSLASLIEGDGDRICLKALKELEVTEYVTVPWGYSITFHFGENPFFTNEKIQKTIVFEEHGDGNSVTPVEWKKGTQVEHYELVSNGKKRRRRNLTFLTWLMTLSDANDEIIRVIRDEIWPNPLPYYSNTKEETECPAAEETSEPGSSEEDAVEIVDYEEGHDTSEEAVVGEQEQYTICDKTEDCDETRDISEEAVVVEQEQYTICDKTEEWNETQDISEEAVVGEQQQYTICDKTEDCEETRDISEEAVDYEKEQYTCEETKDYDESRELCDEYVTFYGELSFVDEA